MFTSSSVHYSGLIPKKRNLCVILIKYICIFCFLNLTKACLIKRSTLLQTQATFKLVFLITIAVMLYYTCEREYKI